MKKIVMPFLLSIICIAAMTCLSDDSPQRGNIKCRVTAADEAAAKNLFNTGSYEFKTAGASVTSGTNNGLRIGAGISSHDGGRKMNIIIHLPAGKDFGAFRDGGSIGYRAPGVPFSVTEKYFGTKKSHHRMVDLPYIHMQEFFRRRKDYSEAKYIWFESFTMKFTEFRIKRKKLYLKAIFEGRVTERHEKMHAAGLTITGEIDIRNAPLGLMFVD